MILRKRENARNLLTEGGKTDREEKTLFVLVRVREDLYGFYFSDASGKTLRPHALKSIIETARRAVSSVIGGVFPKNIMIKALQGAVHLTDAPAPQHVHPAVQISTLTRETIERAAKTGGLENLMEENIVAKAVARMIRDMISIMFEYSGKVIPNEKKEKLWTAAKNNVSQFFLDNIEQVNIYHVPVRQSDLYPSSTAFRVFIRRIATGLFPGHKKLPRLLEELSEVSGSIRMDVSRVMEDKFVGNLKGTGWNLDRTSAKVLANQMIMRFYAVRAQMAKKPSAAKPKKHRHRPTIQQPISSSLSQNKQSTADGQQKSEFVPPEEANLTTIPLKVFQPETEEEIVEEAARRG